MHESWCPPPIAILPPLWRRIESAGNWLTYQSAAKNLALIFGGEIHDDQRWLHLSVCARDRLPTWGEMVEVKEFCLGTEAIAYSVVPPRSEHVNIHPNVLHLWSPVGFRPLPDFRREGGL